VGSFALETYVVQLPGVPGHHMKDVGTEASANILLLTHRLQAPLYQLRIGWKSVHPGVAAHPLDTTAMLVYLQLSESLRSLMYLNKLYQYYFLAVCLNKINNSAFI